MYNIYVLYYILAHIQYNGVSHLKNRNVRSCLHIKVNFMSPCIYLLYYLLLV